MMLTVSIDKTDVLEALRLGARAYVVKGVSGRELVQALRAVVNGERYLSPSLGAMLLTDVDSERGGSKGAFRQGAEQPRSRGPVAGDAGLEQQGSRRAPQLSDKTVKHYLTSVFQKLHVRSRMEAVLLMKKISSGQLRVPHASICQATSAARPARSSQRTKVLRPWSEPVADLSPADRWTFYRTPQPSRVSCDQRQTAIKAYEGVSHGQVHQERSRVHSRADQDRRGACRWSAAVRARRPGACLQPLPWACARSTAPTTTCFPARRSGARPTASSRAAGSGLPAGRRHAVRSRRSRARRLQCRRRRTTTRRTIPTRSSSIRACARSPTCSSTRRWAIRPRS